MFTTVDRLSVLVGLSTLCPGAVSGKELHGPFGVVEVGESSRQERQSETTRTRSRVSTSSSWPAAPASSGFLRLRESLTVSQCRPTDRDERLTPVPHRIAGGAMLVRDGQGRATRLLRSWMPASERPIDDGSCICKAGSMKILPWSAS